MINELKWSFWDLNRSLWEEYEIIDLNPALLDHGREKSKGLKLKIKGKEI